jgi:hypothetical protein
MVLNLNITPANVQGTASYNWTLSQASGVLVSGVSLTNGLSTSVLTYPSTLTYAGNAATSGQYSFVAQCTVTDSGVASCTQTKLITLYFNDTPPACTLTLSNIIVS